MFLKQTVSLAFLLAFAQATFLNNELSFGHGDRISPTLRALPNFNLIGSPRAPEILSNKLVVTPPAPGNQRGAAWAEKPLQNPEWSVDFDFRATGPERAGGNLQIWYARNGQGDVGTSSIYTVGKFDGLAIVIDQYAGSGGFIRGFLNDGSTEYKSHHSVDSLAFGHCTYSYRNRGSPSRMVVSQTSKLFSVKIDGSLCFESTKIKLPLGYNFGISAASAEVPDSFEVFKFVTSTGSDTPDLQSENQPPPYGQAKNQNDEVKRQDNRDSPLFGEPPEMAASQVSSSEQFADLHNRLQGLTRYVTSLTRDMAEFQKVAAKRHDDLLPLLNSVVSATSNLPALMQKLDKLEQLEKKLDRVGDVVRQTKGDLHSSIDHHVRGLKDEVRDSHGLLLGSVKAGTMGWLGWLGVILASQVVTVGAYLAYKRRKSGGTKKYL